MADTTQEVIENSTEDNNSVLANFLSGYRFSLCEDQEAAGRALDVRRRVYVDNVGYQVPVPDEYDQRSWLLLAEDLKTGQAVGTMRVTPRWGGPFEAEEYFRLSRQLRSPKVFELNRFAILPAYRKGKTFLPIVSLGLFKLVYSFLDRIGAQRMILCAKAERIWTYEWLRFARTGIVRRYEKLDGAEHELLISWDFRQTFTVWEGHPFRTFFLTEDVSIVLPKATPQLGVADEPPCEPFRLAVGA